jgi:hypothetical protein
MDQVQQLKPSRDFTGSDGVFEVKPPILNFAGFAVHKTHILKLLIKNVSGAPQRVVILPTNTAFFLPRFNKRGLVAPGMSEEVFVQFSPNEWRYYYDCLRIVGPGGNLNVPINAFPVMSPSERYLPSIVDLGKCPVGEVLTRQIELVSSVPVNFEYELKLLTATRDLLIHPLTGEVPGNGRQTIEIEYRPQSASTTTCEVELQLSEFNFIPQLTKVIASAFHKPVEPSPTKQEVVRPPKVLSKLLGLRQPNTTNPQKQTELPRSLSKATHWIVKPKLLDRIVFEQQFNTDYRNLEEKDREKEFKISICLGNPLPSETDIGKVEGERSEKSLKQSSALHKRDCLRFEPTLDADKVLVDPLLIAAVEPVWDAYKNDDFSLRQLPLQKLVRIVNIVMVRLRAAARLKKLQIKLKEYGVINKEQAKEFVRLDWRQANMTGAGQKDFIAFQFKLVGGDVGSPLFLSETDSFAQEFRQPVSVTPMTSFDDYAEIEAIERQDFDVLGYKDYPFLPASHYLPIEKDRELRAGAETEYVVSIPQGDPLPDETQFVQPCNSIKALVVDPVSLVRPHPHLRQYFSLAESTETDADYPLRPTPILHIIAEDFPGWSPPEDLSLSSHWRQQSELQAYTRPQPLTGPDEADDLSDSDSDSGTTFTLPVPELSTYLSTFETDEDALTSAESCRSLKAEALTAINSQMRETRLDNGAWLPTQLAGCNKQITWPLHKLSLV